MLKSLKSHLAIPLTVTALLLGAAKGQAQLSVTVNPNQVWMGYINVFQLPSNGSGYVTGFAYGTSDLRANFGTTNLILSPCTNVWETDDGIYVQPDGFTPNVDIDANFYVEDNTLVGTNIVSLLNTNVVFSGSSISNTLTLNPEPLTGAPYTSVAFIKTFDGGYVLLSSVTTNLIAGQAFSISLDTTGAAHAQYGFETMGPDANPTNTTLGNVVINATAVVLPGISPIPTRPQSSVLSMYNSSGVYTNHPIEHWLASWSGAGESSFTIPGTGSTVLKYTGLQYAGVEFYDTANGDNSGGSTDYSIDATPYDTFHVDVWTPNANQFGVQLVSLNPTVGPQVDFLPASGVITNNGWISLDIPLTSFTAVNPALVLSHLQQMLWIDNQGGGFTGGTFYIDNVYFYKHSTIMVPTFTASISGGSVQLQFPTQVGTSYDVQYKTSLRDAVWQPLQSSLSGTGSTLTVQDPANQASRFYRLYAH